MVESGKRWRRRVRALVDILFDEFPVPKIPAEFVNDGRHFVRIHPGHIIATSSGHFHRDPDNLRIDFVSHPRLALEWCQRYYAERRIPVKSQKNQSLNVYRAVAEEFGHYLVYLRDGPSEEEDTKYWAQLTSKPSIETHDAIAEEQEVQEFAQSYEPFLKERLKQVLREGRSSHENLSRPEA